MAGRRARAPPPPRRAGRGRRLERHERCFPLVLLLFVGSGCAALMYEIIWFQLLQLVLGSSAVSIARAARHVHGGHVHRQPGAAALRPASRHPLRVYAVLELLIGASGLLMLVAMPAGAGHLHAVVGHGVPGLMLRGLFAAICLLPPTVMMGATLPAVARWVETTPRGVSWLGYFYGGNTIGAVFGCLLAGLLPAARLRHADRDVRRRRPERGGRRRRAGAGARRAPRGARAPPLPNAAAAPARALARPRRWPVYLAIGLSGMTRAGRRGDLDAPVLAAAQRHHLHLLDHPGGVPGRHRPGQRRRLVPRATDERTPRRALGIAQLAADRRDRLDLLEHHERPPLLAGEPAARARRPGSSSRSISCAACGRSCPAACLWGASFPLALAAVASEGQDGGRVVGASTRPTRWARSSARWRPAWCSSAAIGTQNSQRIMIALAAVAALAAAGAASGPTARAARASAMTRRADRRW